MELTKDSDKLVCYLYREYLSRRKSGIDKSNAKHFSFQEIHNLPIIHSWSESDTKATIAEISRADFGKMYLDGGFMANDRFIIYMENRFKKGFVELTDFIAKFIP